MKISVIHLYPDHYSWARLSLKQLENRGESLQWSADDQTNHITLTVTDDLHHRFKFPVCFNGEVFYCIEPFSTLLQRTRLGRSPIPNRGNSLPLEQLQQQLPQAVAKAKVWMIEKRDAFEQQINQKLDQQLEELDRLRERQLQQLELELKSSRLQENRKAHRRATREQDINMLFDQYIDWVEDTMTTEPQPWLQVIAVLTRQEA